MSQPGLTRNLTLPLVTLYGLGNILGAGIYVLVGEVARSAGDFTPLAFLLAAVIALLTALSFAELAARFPYSAGEARYIFEAFHMKRLSTLTGMLIIFTGIISAATMSRGFLAYLGVFINLPDILVLMLLTGTLALIAAWGIKQSIYTAAVLTVIEIGGLLLIIGIGMTVTEPQPSPTFTDAAISNVSWLGVFGGAFLAFYAFIGFEDMVNVAEEIKRPETTLPLAIFLALGGATVLYVMVAVAALQVLPAGELGAASAPLAEVFTTATGRSPIVITAISLLAVINGALVQIIMASRVLYGMAQQDLVWRRFGHIDHRSHTPVLATVVVSSVILLAALWLPLATLATITGYLLLLLFCLINLALVRIKLNATTAPAGFCVPLFVPFIAGLASLGFVAIQSFILLTK